MTAHPPFLRMKRKYEVDESYWLVRRSRSFAGRLSFALRRAALTLRWGRVPKVWELSFIDRMRELGKKGVTFDRVLRKTLPELFGEDTSLVLRTWIGKKARNNPERFARAISKMFGASAHPVLGSIDRLTDDESLFQEEAPKDQPLQSLVEVIQKADAKMMVVRPESPIVVRPDSPKERS